MVFFSLSHLLPSFLNSMHILKKTTFTYLATLQNYMTWNYGLGVHSPTYKLLYTEFWDIEKIGLLVVVPVDYSYLQHCRWHAFQDPEWIDPQSVVYGLLSNKWESPKVGNGICVNSLGKIHQFTQHPLMEFFPVLVTVFQEFIVFDFFIITAEEGESQWGWSPQTLLWICRDYTLGTSLSSSRKRTWNHLPRRGTVRIKWIMWMKELCNLQGAKHKKEIIKTRFPPLPSPPLVPHT